MSQQEYRKPVPRRSSLLAKEVANEEGVNMKFSDVLRTLPPNVREQVARHSNNSRRSSNINNPSINPTPIDSVKARKWPGGAPGSGIPVRPSSSVRKYPRNEQTKTWSKSSKPPLPTGSKKMLPAARHNMGSMTNLNRTTSTNTLSTLRRSVSIDSFRDNGLTPSTSAYTPNLGRSAAASTKIHGERSNYPVSKTIKVPSSTDKRLLNEMAHDINEFIQSKDYPRRMTLGEFNKMPTREYINICVFVASLMMGPSYFQDKIGDPLNAKLLEFSTLVQYPGQLTKSLFKSANVPHSWPSAITFLNWLCARVDAAQSPKLNTKLVSEIGENDFKELVMESYQVLFCHAMNTDSSLEPEVVTDELEVYKTKLQENYMSEVPQSPEELEAIRDEEMDNLKKLEEIPDPTKGIMEARNTYDKLLKDTEHRLKDLKKERNTYKDLSSLHAKSKAFQSMIDKKEGEIERLKSRIGTQPLDKKGQMEMLKEMETLNHQIKTYKSMNDRLNQEVLSKETQSRNLEKRFYDICSKFTVVESFKETARRLRLDIPPVPPNPCEPQGLKDWIKKVENIQEITKSKIAAMQKEVSGNSKKVDRNKDQRLEKEKIAEKQLSELKEKFKVKEEQFTSLEKEIENWNLEAAEAEKELQEEITLLETEKKTLTQDYTALKAECTTGKEEYANLLEKEEEYKQKAEDRTITLLDEANQWKEFFLNHAQQSMKAIRELRVANNLNVDYIDEVLAQFQNSPTPDLPEN